MCDFESNAEEETLLGVQSRHRREERELEGLVRALLRKACKKEKAVVEAKGMQMKFDLKAKHRKEMEKYEGEFMDIIETAFEDPSNNQLPDTSCLSIEAKKSKAARKKDRQKRKSLEREKIKAEIASNAGKSLREDELAIINEHLANDFLVVKEIIADGNCLFRALADQLEFVGANVEGGNEKKLTFIDLRFRAADYIRSHANEYAPFLGVEPASQQFKCYCNNVESDGEWGGQIELKALSSSLRRQIYVYDTSTPLIIMGDDNVGNAPLKITYHRHYFALGAHYNSVTSSHNDS